MAWVHDIVWCEALPVSGHTYASFIAEMDTAGYIVTVALFCGYYSPNGYVDSRVGFCGTGNVYL